MMHFLIGVQGVGKVHAFFGGKEASLFRLFQCFQNVMGFSQGGGDFPFQQDGCFFRFLQAFFYHLRHGGREKLQGHFL